MAKYSKPKRKPYTHEQMSDVFELVQNKKDWKLPINCKVKLTEEQVEILFWAVTYFTGSIAVVRKLHGKTYKVTADGYYNCIGA